MTTTLINSHDLTAQIDRHIRSQLGACDHEKGGTKKMLRYRLLSKIEIALEKRKGRPLLYVAVADLGSFPSIDIDWNLIEASKKGRNSNLNAMDSFKNAQLYRFEVGSVGDVDKVIAQFP